MKYWPWRLATATLLALAMLGWQLPAWAAEPALLAVTAGWDGQVVPGTWAPVRVRLRGGETDLQVVVEAVLQAEWQTPQSTTRYPVGSYGREEALPAGVEKDVVLWVPVEGPSGAEVQVRAGDQVLARKAVDFKAGRTPGWPLVGVLAGDQAMAAAVGEVRIPFQGLPVAIGVAKLAPADIPDAAGRLDALTALVVQGDAAATLSDAQREAVLAWVKTEANWLWPAGPPPPRPLGCYRPVRRQSR